MQGQCPLLESDDGIIAKNTEIPELYSDKDETDTRIVLYCVYAKSKAMAHNVSVANIVMYVSSCYITHQSVRLASSMKLVQGTREVF